MKNAFSLVELSVVLVIIGLLIGGLLAGQSLIRAAELRSVTTEYQRYVIAVKAFRGKYRGLPGDTRHATRVWGEVDSDPATCSTTEGTGTETCNGDGNGIVYSDNAQGSNELFRFWQHLGNAGLIEGSYSGISGPGQFYYDAVIDTNVPSSVFGKAGWSVYSSGYLTGNPQWFDGNYDNVFLYGEKLTNSFTEAPAMKPEEAWNLDSKLDDQVPTRGVVRSHKTWSDCNTNSNMSAAYNLSNTTKACALVFGNNGKF